jgi:hypothetical protein
LAWKAFSESLVANRDALLERAHARRGEAATTFQAALDSAEAALAGLGEADEAVRFVTSFPSKPRWLVRSPIVPALASRSDEPPTAAAALAELRTVADPPQPPAPPILGGIDVAALEAQAVDEPELGVSLAKRAATNLVR